MLARHGQGQEEGGEAGERREEGGEEGGAQGQGTPSISFTTIVVWVWEMILIIEPRCTKDHCNILAPLPCYCQIFLIAGFPFAFCPFTPKHSLLPPPFFLKKMVCPPQPLIIFDLKNIDLDFF